MSSERKNRFKGVIGAREILRSSLEEHTLVLGLERSGKTSGILKPLVYEILTLKTKGMQIGLSVIEPRGDLARLVADMSKEMNITHAHVDMSLGKNSDVYNPLIGDVEESAEIMYEIAKVFIGRSENFSLTIMKIIVQHVTRLLKGLYGNTLDALYVFQVLANPLLLKEELANYKRDVGDRRLISFFEYELTSGLSKKHFKIASCVEEKLEERNWLIDESYVLAQGGIDVIQHLKEGNVLAINTNLGNDESFNNVFGMSVLMNLQNRVLKRDSIPKVPHIIIVDESYRYINQDTNFFLSLSKRQKVTSVFTTRKLAELNKISKGSKDEEILLSKFKNRIVFGLLTTEDAYTCSEMFGKERVGYYNGVPIIEKRFKPSDILNGLSRFQFIHQLIIDDETQSPSISTCAFVPKDWRRKREWETSSFFLDLQQENE